MPSKSEIDVLVVDGEGSGGMSHYAQNLTRGLALHCRAELHTIDNDEGMECENSIGKLLYKTKYGRKWRINYSRTRYKIIARALVHSYRPKIIHIASRIASMKGLVDELNKLGTAVVTTVHDPVPHHEQRTLWGKIYTRYTNHYLLPNILQGCHALHVHSNLHAAQLANRYHRLDRSKIYVVPHIGGTTECIATGSNVPDEIKTLRNNRHSTALFFGRIEPYKGVDILISAFREVSRANSDFHLIIAGAGRMPEIPSELKPHITVINRFINDQEIRALFESCSFATLPYIEATQSGVIPLASAFSMPVIATNVGAIPEIIIHEKTGLIVQALDPNHLAKAIIHLLQNPDISIEMGKAAKSHMEECYGYSSIGLSHLNSYHKIFLEDQ